MSQKKNTIAEPADTCPPANTEYQKSRARTLIMIGLTLGMLLAILDMTMVGTSLPRIVGELGGIGLYAWIITAYLLSSTIMIPIAGKMSDRYGRKPIFLTGIILFLIGSALSGLSQDIDQLIMFRFVQGLGAGIIMPIVFAAVADFYAPADRGKAIGMLSAFAALAMVAGPFIGGFIVDNLSWQWVFYVNLPLGIIAIIVTSWQFPNQITDVRKHLDYLGMATLTTLLIAVLLIITWGGSTYTWNSIEIIGLAALSVLSFLGFIEAEIRAEDPVLPLGLFRNRVFSLCAVGLFIVGIGLYAVLTFLPLFMQAVIGVSATNSGATLIPGFLGLVATSIASGFLVKRTGYKVWMIIGPPIAALGLYMLSTLTVGSSQVNAYLYTFIFGLGLGMIQANYTVAAQNVLGKKDIGVGTAMTRLFQNMGMTVGVTVLGSVINQQMVTQLATNLPAGSAAMLPSTNINDLGGLLLNPMASAQIPTTVLDAIRLSLSNSLTYMFLVAAGIVLIALIIGVIIKSVPMKSAEEYREKESDGIMSMNTYKKILIPTDGSKYSRSAIEHALDIAKQSNSEITVLNVIDTEKATSTLQDLALVSEASAVVITSQAVICEATTMAEKKGVPMKTEVRTGDPASVINELSGNYDLIIMGTKGLHGLPHLLLGSVAEKVARGSKCQVMVIKNEQLVDGRTLLESSGSKMLPRER